MSDNGAGQEAGDVLVRLSRLEAAYDRLEDDSAGLAALAAPNGSTPAPEPAEPLYGDVEAWVTGFFGPVFARRMGGATNWCASWWEHAEAILRLEALWRSWEVLRRDPGTGMGVWLRDFLEPQRLVLMGDSGPFHGCQETVHSGAPELPVNAAPAGHWGTDTRKVAPV